MVNPESIKLKISRRKNPTDAPYWEEFNIPYRPNMNIVSVLMEIRKHPQMLKAKQLTL